MKQHGRPSYLPQISQPLTEVLQKLTDEGIDYEMIQTDPNTLNPSQPFVYSDEIKSDSLNESNPIWIDNENNLVDGHHRWCGSMFAEQPIFAVKVKLNFRDACRMLNKIQDIYDYEENLKMEEDVANDYINDYNGNDNDEKNEFLSSLEIDNSKIVEEKSKENSKTEKIIAYRKEPLKADSVVGNFFSLKPSTGFDKYEIEFDNLLNTKDLGINYKSGQIPVDILAKAWFPHVDFETLAKQYNADVINLKTKAIATKAMQNGFDGILFGDSLVLGLK